MTDLLLDRINFDPKFEIRASASYHPNKLKQIPWGSLAPVPQAVRVDYLQPGSALPKVDVVIVTWTVAEKTALFDVLAMGAPEYVYSHLFSAYRPDLTGRSPAAEAHCLGTYRLIGHGSQTIMLFHSNLHVSTDGPKLPLQRLVDQIIEETQCARLITTGTAGGIGDVMVGDVIVGQACQFNCQKDFAKATFAKSRYPTTLPCTFDLTLAGPLFAVNAGQLDAYRKLPSGAPAPILMHTNADIETVDWFAYGTNNDHFGIHADDPEAMAVEMDDAVFGLVIAARLAAAKHVPFWGAVRNVSDPQAVDTQYDSLAAMTKAMADIYRRTGYWDSVGSVIASYLMAVL